MGAVIAAILDVGCFPAVAGLFLTLRSLRSERGEFIDYFPQLGDTDCSRPAVSGRAYARKER